MLKIDFERAFDHINWHFLVDLLKARGFSKNWVGWTLAILHSSSTAVLLNGTPSSYFQCKRGLCQGDPFFPLLFILCIDVLFRMLHLATLHSLLPPVGAGDVNIHALQFADDLLIFFDGSRRSAGVIKVVLDAFSAASGLKINFSKSSIIPINLESSRVGGLANFFGCPTIGFPFTYLGLPLSPKALRKSDYLPLIEKLHNRLAGWKGLLLSRGGRLALLNSVLSGIPTYFCSAFLLPAWVSKAVDRVRWGFFWKGKKINNGFHCLVKWEQVCRPKRFGGIGIWNIRSMNSALLMKGL